MKPWIAFDENGNPVQMGLPKPPLGKNPPPQDAVAREQWFKDCTKRYQEMLAEQTPTQPNRREGTTDELTSWTFSNLMDL